MNTKHLLPLGIILSFSLIMTAVFVYPGGSNLDATFVGFDWHGNYLCHLFAEKAINGAHNTSRIWAIAGWGLLCICYIGFFISFPKRIAMKGAANVIRYSGILSIILAFMAMTPYHDIMVTLASTALLVSVFYIAIMLLKSGMKWLAIFSFIVMLESYVSSYVYFTQSYLNILPTLQQTGLILFAIWVLSLYYLTRKEDFRLKTA